MGSLPAPVKGLWFHLLPFEWNMWVPDNMLTDTNLFNVLKNSCFKHRFWLNFRMYHNENLVFIDCLLPARLWAKDMCICMFSCSPSEPIIPFYRWGPGGQAAPQRSLSCEVGVHSAYWVHGSLWRLCFQFHPGLRSRTGVLQRKNSHCLLFPIFTLDRIFPWLSNVTFSNSDN